MNKRGFDGLTIVGLAFFLFMGFNLVKDMGNSESVAHGAEISSIAPPEIDANQYSEMIGARGGSETITAESLTPEEGVDVSAVSAPYDHYALTQGPHGYSYGHMAIDLAAGKGATIKSPINGTVTELYVDEYGNPTIVIENDHYQVIMLHGDYTAGIGEPVAIGQPVGTESNHGYTTDMQGNLCRGRNCGYHTHLNIYDKWAGKNVNPLDLIGR